MDTASMISVGLSQTYDRNKIVEPSVSNPIKVKDDRWHVFFAKSLVRMNRGYGQLSPICMNKFTVAKLKAAASFWQSSQPMNLDPKITNLHYLKKKTFLDVFPLSDSPIQHDLPDPHLYWGARLWLCCNWSISSFRPWKSMVKRRKRRHNTQWKSSGFVIPKPDLLLSKIKCHPKKGSACNSWELELFFNVKVAVWFRWSEVSKPSQIAMHHGAFALLTKVLPCASTHHHAFLETNG